MPWYSPFSAVPPPLPIGGGTMALRYRLAVFLDVIFGHGIHLNVSTFRAYVGRDWHPLFRIEVQSATIASFDHRQGMGPAVTSRHLLKVSETSKCIMAVRAVRRTPNVWQWHASRPPSSLLPKHAYDVPSRPVTPPSPCPAAVLRAYGGNAVTGDGAPRESLGKSPDGAILAGFPIPWGRIIRWGVMA